jgi:hypothetical protein
MITSLAAGLALTQEEQRHNEKLYELRPPCAGPEAVCKVQVGGGERLRCGAEGTLTHPTLSEV